MARRSCPRQELPRPAGPASYRSAGRSRAPGGTPRPHRRRCRPSGRRPEVLEEPELPPLVATARSNSSPREPRCPGRGRPGRAGRASPGCRAPPAGRPRRTDGLAGATHLEEHARRIRLDPASWGARLAAACISVRAAPDCPASQSAWPYDRRAIGSLGVAPRRRRALRGRCAGRRCRAAAGRAPVECLHRRLAPVATPRSRRETNTPGSAWAGSGRNRSPTNAANPRANTVVATAAPLDERLFGLDRPGGPPAALPAPAATSWRDSPHLTQNSHLSLFRVPQAGQSRKSAMRLA